MGVIGQKPTAMPRTGGKELQSPYPWLLGLLVVAFVGFMTFSTIIPQFFPSWNKDATSRVSALFVALTGLFVGTIVSMKIYDYVNARNQIRQWRHEYALRRVDGIYVPLWEQTRGLIKSMEHYDDVSSWRNRAYFPGSNEPKLTGFKEVMESHLGIFLDSKARQLLQSFHDSVDEYEKAHSLAWTELQKSTTIEISKLTGETQFSGHSSEMFNVFISNRIMVYDSNQEVESYVRESFVSAHSRIFHEHEKALADFNAILNRLRNLEEIKKLRQKQKAGLPKGEAVLARLKEIIENPISVVLDFEDRT